MMGQPAASTPLPQAPPLPELVRRRLREVLLEIGAVEEYLRITAGGETDASDRLLEAHAELRRMFFPELTGTGELESLWDEEERRALGWLQEEIDRHTARPTYA